LDEDELLRLIKKQHFGGSDCKNRKRFEMAKFFFLKKKVDFLNQPFFRVWVTVI